MADRVELILQVLGSDASSAEVDKVISALERLRNQAGNTTAAAQQLSSQNKDVKLGLGAIANVVSLASPELGRFAHFLSATKLAAQGVGEVLKNVGTAASAAMSALLNPVFLGLAVVLAVITVAYRALSSSIDEAKAKQDALNESVARGRKELEDARAGRKAAGEREARAIVGVAGEFGVPVGGTEQVESIQTRANRLQSEIPMLGRDEAIKFAAQGAFMGQSIDENIMAASILSKGIAPDVPSGTPAQQAAVMRMGMAATMGVTDVGQRARAADRAALAILGESVAATGAANADVIGGMGGETEDRRRRLEGTRHALRVMRGEVDAFEAQTVIGGQHIGPAFMEGSGTGLKVEAMNRNLDKIEGQTNINSIVMNRSGSTMGANGTRPASTQPVN